jgi:hypothetical protein
MHAASHRTFSPWYARGAACGVSLALPVLIVLVICCLLAGIADSHGNGQPRFILSHRSHLYPGKKHARRVWHHRFHYPGSMFLVLLNGLPNFVVHAFWFLYALGSSCLIFLSCCFAPRAGTRFCK